MTGKACTQCRQEPNEHRQKLKARVRDLFQYFRDACERLRQMGQNWVDLGKGESLQAGYARLDSVILACSYLDALSVFRFGELLGGGNLIQFLQKYPDPEYCDYYRKVSSVYLDQPPLDKSGKPIQPKQTPVASIREALYGSGKPDVSQEISLDQARQRLKAAGIQVTDKELNRFSYAAYFYEWYRCYGVHNVQPLTDISREFILGTLNSAINNFEREVFDKVDNGEGPDTANDWVWFKETYRLKSRFFESVLKYRRWGT